MGTNFFICLILFSLLLMELSLLVSATLNIKINIYRMLSISVFDGIICAVVPLISIINNFIYIFFVIIFFCSIIVIFVPKDIKLVALLAGVLVAYMLLGWGVLYILQLLFFSLFKIGKISYFWFLVFRWVVVFSVINLLIVAYRRIYRLKSIKKFLYDSKITLCGTVFGLKLFFDSGNGLYDPLTGQPIIVVSIKSLDKINLKSMDKISQRSISYLTITGEPSFMPILAAEKIEITNDGKTQTIDAMIGLTSQNFDHFDGLIPSGVELGE